MNYTSLIENVGFEPRFCVPGAACCHYTTFSRKRLQRGAARPVDERLAPVLVPSGHRLAPTEPAGETRSGAETEPVSSDMVSRAHRVRKLLAHRARDRQSGVLAFILWSLISPWQAGEYRPAFFVFEPSDQPLFSAVLLTTMISSIVTSNISARITKLSIVGNAVPWIHL